MGKIHTNNALVLHSCASFCKTQADFTVLFVTGHLLFCLFEEHRAANTLRVRYEIRLRWTDKVSPEERDDRVGLWEIEQVAHRDRLDQAAAKGNRIFGYETHWIEKRQA